MSEKLELLIEMNGGSGITIKAKLAEQYNCGEFTLNSNFQPVFISPWMQFEPSAMNAERGRIATEITRRAIDYPVVVESMEKLRLRLEDALDGNQDRINMFHAAIDMWRAERVNSGLPADFSDIKAWPHEFDMNYMRRNLQETPEQKVKRLEGECRVLQDRVSEILGAAK